MSKYDCVNIKKTKIVGYNDRLLQDLLPRVVCPIFHIIKTEYVIQPGIVSGGFILEGDVYKLDEFKRMVDREQFTELKTPIVPQPRHDLWVDIDWTEKYTERDEREENHNKIAIELVDKAKKLIREKRIEEADTTLDIAFNYNAQLIDIIAIQCCIHNLNGETGITDFLIKSYLLIDKTISKDGFMALIEHYEYKLFK